MKILVIGNGFIGSAIIKRLESEGHELLIFSRTFNSGINSQQIIGDVFSFDDFAKTLLWGPQVIIHTAWITTHTSYADDSSNFQYAKFTALLARNVAHSNLEHLIVLGTCAEYGPQSRASTAGITKLNPTTFYAKQKVVALNSIKEAFLDSKVRLTWARIFQPYGLKQDPSRLLPFLIDSIKNGKPVELRDTTSLLDWITTRDIASAISWIISHDTNIEVDIGTNVGYTNVELLQHLEALLGETKQFARIAAQPHAGNGVTVVGKNSPLFLSGWLPKDSLKDGLDWVLSS
jgi:nucleoside-diphosphate-sugar epimerase